MHDPCLDHAAAILRASGRVAMPLDDLARAVRDEDTAARVVAARSAPSDPTGLERRLRFDPRFIVLEPVIPLPGIEDWASEARAAYADAFARIELVGPKLVVLDDDEPSPDAFTPLAKTLRLTLLGVAGLADAPELAAAAEEARATLDRVIGSPETSRSTTPPPGPRQPA